MTASPEAELRWFLECWHGDSPSLEEIAGHFRSVFAPAEVADFLARLKDHAPAPELESIDSGAQEALALLEVGDSRVELWVATTSDGISGFSVRPYQEEIERIPFGDLLADEPRVYVSAQPRAAALADRFSPVIEEARAAGLVGISLRIVLANGGGSVGVDAGFADAFTREPVARSTRFRIGSVTKVLTALAILRVVDPDEPVKNRSRTLEVDSDAVTFRHLLTHTAGIPRLRDGRVTFERPPGEDRAYSNDGYVLLGSVLADVHGKPYPEVVPASEGSELAIGHRVAFSLVERAAWQADESGAGGAELTADGLVALAEQAAGPEGELLRSIVFDGRDQLGHDGALSGFRASWWTDTRTGASCAVLSNTEGPAAPPPWDVRDRLFAAVRDVD